MKIAVIVLPIVLALAPAAPLHAGLLGAAIRAAERTAAHDAERAAVHGVERAAAHDAEKAAAHHGEAEAAKKLDDPAPGDSQPGAQSSGSPAAAQNSKDESAKDDSSTDVSLPDGGEAAESATAASAVEKPSPVIDAIATIITAIIMIGVPCYFLFRVYKFVAQWL